MTDKTDRPTFDEWAANLRAIVVKLEHDAIGPVQAAMATTCGGVAEVLIRTTAERNDARLAAAELGAQLQACRDERFRLSDALVASLDEVREQRDEALARVVELETTLAQVTS